MNIRLRLLPLSFVSVILLGVTSSDLVSAQTAEVQRMRSARRRRASTLLTPQPGCVIPPSESNWNYEGNATDLSGVYSGSIDFAELKLSGNVKVIIDKDRFTLVENNRTHTGRVRATTIFDYTAVAFAFDVSTAAGPVYETVSVNAVPTRRGSGISFKSVCGETLRFSMSLTSDRDNMYDVHFVTEPITMPVNIITDLKWRQCKDRDKDPKKCPWKAAGDPEKMLGTYHYFVEWSDGRSRNGEIDVTSDKTFKITAP